MLFRNPLFSRTSLVTAVTLALFSSFIWSCKPRAQGSQIAGGGGAAGCAEELQKAKERKQLEEILAKIKDATSSGREISLTADEKAFLETKGFEVGRLQIFLNEVAVTDARLGPLADVLANLEPGETLESAIDKDTRTKEEQRKNGTCSGAACSTFNKEYELDPARHELAKNGQEAIAGKTVSAEQHNRQNAEYTGGLLAVKPEMAREFAAGFEAELASFLDAQGLTPQEKAAREAALRNKAKYLKNGLLAGGSVGMPKDFNQMAGSGFPELASAEMRVEVLLASAAGKTPTEVTRIANDRINSASTLLADPVFRDVVMSSQLTKLAVDSLLVGGQNSQGVFDALWSKATEPLSRAQFTSTIRNSAFADPLLTKLSEAMDRLQSSEPKVAEAAAKAVHEIASRVEVRDGNTYKSMADYLGTRSNGSNIDLVKLASEARVQNIGAGEVGPVENAASKKMTETFRKLEEMKNKARERSEAEVVRVAKRK